MDGLQLTTPFSSMALRHSKANKEAASSGLLGSAGAEPLSTHFFGGMMIDEDFRFEVAVWSWKWKLVEELRWHRSGYVSRLAHTLRWDQREMRLLTDVSNIQRIGRGWGCKERMWRGRKKGRGGGGDYLHPWEICLSVWGSAPIVDLSWLVGSLLLAGRQMRVSNEIWRLSPSNFVEAFVDNEKLWPYLEKCVCDIWGLQAALAMNISRCQRSSTKWLPIALFEWSI